MKAGVASRGRVAGAAGLLVLVAAALLAASASAGSPTIDYPDFSGIAGLTLNGDAAQAGSSLRLTPATPLQHGSAWSQTKIDTTQPFESVFRADVHDGSVPPADGMTFAIQSQGLSALGDNGGGHGYASFLGHQVTPSVALDISLYPNRNEGLAEQFAIVQNGDLFAPLASVTSPAVLYGQPFQVWVDYDAKGHSLQAFVSQSSTKPAAPLLSAPVDLAATVGPSAYAGFTAGTGGLDANFDLLGWSVQGLSDTTPPTVSCSASPAVIWPPNNKLVPVATQVSVADSGSGPAGFTLVSVASNEGSVVSESSGWSTGSPDTSGFLQAARSGSGTGRVYTLTYQGSDGAGNTTTCSTTVTVPHDQGS